MYTVDKLANGNVAIKQDGVNIDTNLPSTAKLEFSNDRSAITAYFGKQALFSFALSDLAALQVAGVPIALPGTIEALMNSLSINFFFDVTDAVTQLNKTELIQSLSDFPAPVGGVITLLDGFLYQINGAVNILTNRIELNGAELFGKTHHHDSIESTAVAGFMFTAQIGFDTRLTELTIITTGANVPFESLGSGSEIVLIVGCDFEDKTQTSILPSELSSQLIVQILGCTFFSGAKGFELDGNGLLLEITNCGFEDIKNNAKFITLLPGNVFQIINISNDSFVNVSNGTFLTGEANSANVGGEAKLSNNNFSGAGDYVTGITRNDLKWIFSQNLGNKGTDDSTVISTVYFKGNTASTVIAAAGLEGTIASFADGGGGNLLVTTDVAHGLSNGLAVWLVNGAIYNDEYVVANVTATTFTVVAAFTTTDALHSFETGWVDVVATYKKGLEERTSSTAAGVITINALFGASLEVISIFNLLTAGGGTKDVEMGIFLNGGRCTASTAAIESKTTANGSTSSCIFLSKLNDAYRTKLRNITDTVDVVVQSMAIVGR